VWFRWWSSTPFVLLVAVLLIAVRIAAIGVPPVRVRILECGGL
jgi:hypothetical protein